MQVVFTVKDEKDAETMNACYLSKGYKVISSVAANVSVSSVDFDSHIVGTVYFVLENK